MSFVIYNHFERTVLMLERNVFRFCIRSPSYICGYGGMISFSEVNVGLKKYYYIQYGHTIVIMVILL